LPPRPPPDLDVELADLPAELRWREWLARVEAVLFVASQPVTRETLARVVGRACRLDLLLDDLSAELRGRPYELVKLGGGYAFRTRARFGDAIRAAFAVDPEVRRLSKLEAGVLAAIAYEQPITRAALSERFGREISRDLIATLRDKALIAPGPRAPKPGAPFAYVTTARFLEIFGLETLGDLPDLEMLRDAGLLSRDEPRVADSSLPIEASAGDGNMP
jgi:segregation and condensation protein B